jgi:hypothetical protein
MENSLHNRSEYTAHRRLIETDPLAPLGVETLVALSTSHPRAAIDADGYDTAYGYIVQVGGDAPTTVTLQPCERVDYTDDSGTAQQRYVDRGSSIGPLSSGDAFAFDVEGGGRWLLRISAITGSPDVPDEVHIYLTGGKRANEGSS